MVNLGTTARRRPWSKRRTDEPERQCLGCHRMVQGRRFCSACRKKIEDGQPVQKAEDFLTYDDLRWFRRWNRSKP